MAFRLTPKELRVDNITPLDPAQIEIYANMSQTELGRMRALHEEEIPLKQQKTFIAAGCQTVQRPPRNLIDDPDEIYSLLAETSDQLAAIIQPLKRRAKFEIKPPNRGKPDKNGFSLKSRVRFNSKAEEYATEELDERPYSRLVATVRTTLVTPTTRDTQKLSELFRP